MKFRDNCLFVVLICSMVMALFSLPIMAANGESASEFVQPGRFNADQILQKLSGIKATELKRLIEKNSVLASPEKGAAKIGWDAAEEGFGIIGAGISLSSEALGVAVLNNINNLMGEFGLAFAVARLALEIDMEKPAPAVTNFVKSAGFYAIGKFGFKALKISSIGIFAIDYSLHKFAAKAVEAKYADWEKAYENYYRQRRASPKFAKVATRRAPDWKKLIMKIIEDADSPQQIHEKVDAEIERYINAFWQDDDGQAFALGTLNKTAINLDEKKYRPQIIANARKMLVETVLQPVFKAITLDIQKEQKMELRGRALKVSNLLNRSFTIKVELVGLPGKTSMFPVKVVTGKNQKNWQGKTNAKRQWNHRFTLLGFLYAEPTGEIILEGLGADKKQSLKQKFSFDSLEEKEIKVVFNFENDVSVRITEPGAREFKFGEKKKSLDIKFMAVTEAAGDYSFVWDFAGKKVIDKVKAGKKSSVTHKFSDLADGKTFRCALSLIKDEKELASDSIELVFKAEKKDEPDEKPAIATETAAAQVAPLSLDQAALSTHCRYFINEQGVITDSESLLQWLVCQKSLDWDSARKWAENNATDGGGWHLPSRQEAQTVTKAGRASLYPVGQLFLRQDGASVLEFFWISEQKKNRQGLNIACVSQRGLEDRFTWHFSDGKFGVVAVRKCDQKGLKAIAEAKKLASAIPSLEKRFKRSAEGVITDTYTGFEWYTDNSAATWKDVQVRIEGWKVDGGGWRLPTIEELRTIYSYYRPVITKEAIMSGKELFTTNGIWSSTQSENMQLHDKSLATVVWCMSPFDGYEYYSSLENPFGFTNLYGIRRK